MMISSWKPNSMKKAAVLVCTLSLLSPWGLSQSTTIQSLGAIPVGTMINGLGWNTGDYQEEYIAAKTAHSQHARITSCGWSAVEGQSAPPNNVSTGYTLPTACSNDILWAAENGQTPTLVAAYGAPYHQILTVQTSSAVAKGATSIPLTLIPGSNGETFSNVVFPYDYLYGGINPITNVHSYAGTLITGITITDATHATITLASALLAAMTASEALTINELLYPSAATGHYTTDTSIQKYAAYAEKLGSLAVAITTPHGIGVDIELWNEPPWGSDFWDNRTDGYDTDPGVAGELARFQPNFGFVDAIQNTPHVGGVTYTWAGTEKSGAASLVGPRMLTYSGDSFIQPAQNVTRESGHPYGNNPEDGGWNEVTLAANQSGSPSPNLLQPNSSNFYLAEEYTLQARTANGPTYGIFHNITETGCFQNLSKGTCPTDAQKARFLLRQYLSYMWDDMEYIEFYRLFDFSDGTSDPGFGSIKLLKADGTECLNYTDCQASTSYSVLPAFTALKGYLDDLSGMAHNPVVPYTLAGLTQVSSWSGTYQLAVGHVVAARSTSATANTEVVSLWQISAKIPSNCPAPTPTDPNPDRSACWFNIPSPTAAPVTATLPTGFHVTSVVDGVTRTAVSYTTSGRNVTFSVADNPIEMIVDPN
jgi:hypothetical protein